MSKETLNESNSLISKIGDKENKNNQILALVIAICLAILIYQWDFLGLGFLKSTEKTVIAPEPEQLIVNEEVP